MAILSNADSLVVSPSETPIVRAGYANAILVPLVAGLILSNQALSDVGAPPWIRAIVLVGIFLAALWLYSHSMSRICVGSGPALHLVTPFFKVEMPCDEIVSARVLGIPSSMTLIVSLKLRLPARRRFYYCIAPHTDAGTYAASRQRLTELLGKATTRTAKT